MGFLLPLIGWPAAVALAALAVWSTWDIFHDELWRRAAQWVTPLPFATAAVALLTALGALPALDGALASLTLAALTALALWRAPGTARYLLWSFRNDPARLAAALRNAAPRLAAVFRSGIALTRRRAPADDGPVPPGAAPDGPGPRRAVPVQRPPVDPGDRPAPPVREDPALGDPGQPEDIAEDLAASGVAVPAHWAALADRIAAFEPADEDELRDEIAGDAAGALHVAEAIRARADTLLTVTGLDPAYVAGHADFADEFAGMAQAAALVHRRFYVIYNAIRDFVSGGGVLPHRAREFFGGDGAAPAGDGEAAA